MTERQNNYKEREQMDEATELKTHRALDHYDNFKFFLFTKMSPHLAGSVPTIMQLTKYCSVPHERLPDTTAILFPKPATHMGMQRETP